LLKLLPGTLIANEAEQNGYRASKQPPYSVFSNKWLDAESFRELYWLSECVEKYVNNRYFVSIWRYLLRSSEDMSLFFSSLARHLFEQGYYWKAATQETLSSILLSRLQPRADFPVLMELLCYDWLRCGHRFLPEHLKDETQGVDMLRKRLFHQLPETLAGCYDKSDRAYFFKKSVFYLFSRESLYHMGYEVKSTQGIIRFSSQREKNVLRLHRAQLIVAEE
jgi:hypothetical protein